jgi:hypothetical protein
MIHESCSTSAMTGGGGGRRPFVVKSMRMDITVCDPRRRCGNGHILIAKPQRKRRLLLTGEIRSYPYVGLAAYRDDSLEPERKT